MKTEHRALKRIGERLGIDESKGYAAAVTFVLVFAAVLVAGYFVYLLATSGPPEGYTTIYLLSSERTLELPETVVIGQNNKFSVWVTAVNHMRRTLSFEIRLKITGEANPELPVNVEPRSIYPMTLEDGERSEDLATVTIDSPGRYMVFFELWSHDEAGATFKNYCVMNIEAIS